MTKKSCRLSLQFLKYHLILSISFKSKIQNKICEMLLTLHPRFQATPKAASSRRAPEQNVKIFPAKHAQYVIWVFPRVSPFPLQFPLSVLKVPSLLSVTSVNLTGSEHTCKISSVNFPILVSRRNRRQCFNSRCF